jgi:hypothetical protein
MYDARLKMAGLTRTAALIALSVSTLARADDERLPAAVQVVMLKKIFQFDRDLETRDAKVAVAATDDAMGEAEKIAAAFQQAHVDARTAKVSALSASLGSFNVVYAMPGAMTPVLKDVCQKGGALTVSGTGSEAAKGEVSVALGKKPDGKPEIIINLKSAKSEKHNFAASLLGLATVVQ